MSRTLLLLLLGALIGGGATALILTRDDPDPERTNRRAPGGEAPASSVEKHLRTELATLQAAHDELLEDRRELQDRVARLEQAAQGTAEEQGPAGEPAAGPTRPEAAGMPDDEEVESALRALLGALPRLAQGGETPDAVLAIRDMSERGGRPLLDSWIADFDDDATDLQLRVALAHALAQSGDPQALQHLKDTLGDPDEGFFLHRFASHALAFSPADDLEPFLTLVARRNEDPGVRANAAFGLARRGSDEGIALYLSETDKAVERGDSAAIGYLSGFQLVPEKALPEVRKRLLTYEDPQTVLILIEILKGRGDTGAVPTLERLAYDSTKPPTIQKAAQGAIKALTPDPQPESGETE